ncbi:hypothetical protein [Spirulina subsalsa]|uniref:hypothetical protein n=1 Tax=Spirulina subsalsa TaxID=54311 RepID=UPI0002E19D05|nr:hypothetical protein [Spirulina subsalsa]
MKSEYQVQCWKRYLTTGIYALGLVVSLFTYQGNSGRAIANYNPVLPETLALLARGCWSTTSVSADLCSPPLKISQF